jgi:hypothetical protein
VNGCFRIYDSLFEKKEGKTVEKKEKVEVTEPPKKEYKCKYFTYLLTLFLYGFYNIFFYPDTVIVTIWTLILLVCSNNVHM